jgi:tryptophan synthase alpha chain
LAKVPVAAGFGISNESEAKEIARSADGIIVGSLFVKIIETASEDDRYLNRLSKQTASLKKVLQ